MHVHVTDFVIQSTTLYAENILSKKYLGIMFIFPCSTLKSHNNWIHYLEDYRYIILDSG